MNQLKTLKLAITLMFVTAAAHAANFNSKDLKGWRVNDLKGSKFSLLMNNADATIVPEKGLSIPTVIVHSWDLLGHKTPGESVKAWEAFVHKHNPTKKMAFTKAKTFKVDGQWRFYAELLIDVHTETQLHTSLMLMVHKGKIVAFTFDDDNKVEFNSNLEKVKGLYHKIKIQD